MCLQCQDSRHFPYKNPRLGSGIRPSAFTLQPPSPPCPSGPPGCPSPPEGNLAGAVPIGNPRDADGFERQHTKRCTSETRRVAGKPSFFNQKVQFAFLENGVRFPPANGVFSHPSEYYPPEKKKKRRRKKTASFWSAGKGLMFYGQNRSKEP